MIDPFQSLSDPIYEIHEAWRKWKVESCTERHGQHLWYLIVENCYEEESVDLRCEYCPVEVPDVFVTDYIDLIHGTLGQLTITDGIPNLTGEYHIPVNVEFHAETYTSMNSITPEYDLWIELTLRGAPPRTAEVPHCYSV